MAFTFQSKRLGFDNIAVGSATGIERHVVGGGPGDATTRISRDGITAGSSTLELHVNAGLVSANSLINTGGPTTDRVSGDIPGSTSNSSFYTSDTSWTSKFPENPVAGASTS